MKLLPYIFSSLCFLLSCEKKTVVENSQKRDFVEEISIPTKFSIEQYDNTKGLSNSSVNCIFQDSEKLMWIGTWDGLNRFDGNSFKIFRPENTSDNAISNQVVLKIAEGRPSEIWLITMQGISRYDKKNNHFDHYFFSDDKNPVVSESQFQLAVHPDKTVFCAVKTWGIGAFVNEKFQKINADFLQGKSIKIMDFDQTDNLFLLTYEGIFYQLKLSKNQNWTIIEKAEIASNVADFEIGKNVKYLSASGQLFQLDSISKSSEKVTENVKALNGTIFNHIIFEEKSGQLNVDSLKKNNFSWLKSFKNNKVTTIFQGSENVVWVGTDGDGIFKIQPQKTVFNLVSKTQVPQLDGGIVRTFLRDKKFLWIGTKGKGLLQLPWENINDANINPKIFDDQNANLNNSVYALEETGENLMIIGTDGEGISVFDRQTNKIFNWRQLSGTANLPYFKSVYTIYKDSSHVYLGTNGYGLIKFQLSRSKSGFSVKNFQQFRAGNIANSLSSDIIFSIIPENENQLWIGTRLGGLNLFDKKTQKFIIYKNQPDSPKSLSNNDVLSLAKDKQNRLFVGTSFGLNLMQKDENGLVYFERFSEESGLSNNTIHGIIPANNSLWLSTNFGITYFDLNNKKSRIFTKSDGLQNNEFSDGATYFDANSGLVFMGGIKGFNYFLPQKMNESSQIPDLFLEEISGQNQKNPFLQSVVISPGKGAEKKLKLKHNENFFDIHLSAITFIDNEKCSYAYKLEGFDKDWNYIDNRKIISFTNVPPGNYSLLLKWTNNDQVWSVPTKAIDIQIKAVWWQSNFALLSYGIFAIGFLFFVRSYKQKQASLQQNILIREKEEALHENRLSFFTNIAHEFLTPLTLIVGPANKLAENTNLDAKSDKYLHMIQRNSSRLLFLTQQLLEFRKAEDDHLANTVKKFDLTELVEQIAELFDDWALDKSIDFQLNASLNLEGWFDKDKLEKIIFNLLSNAFKYTPSGGKITMDCHIKRGDFEELNIKISNSGKGISKEKLDSLFDRFFLSDTNQDTDPEMFRTGIGLAYVNKLVNVLRGKIDVKSVEDKMTTFLVTIPCESNAFSEKEIDLVSSSVVMSAHLRNILEESNQNYVVPSKMNKIENLASSKKKIMVVEDEGEIHAYIAELLSDNYQIIAAFNGVEALEKMKQELPDLIISDVMMPEMDGVTLCKIVKTDLRTCHIPFIMLTAKNAVQHKLEGLENGANSYIPKPFYPEHLLLRIQKLLEEKELIFQHFTHDNLLSTEISTQNLSETERTFAKKIVELIKTNIANEQLNVSFLQNKLAMSTTQLHRKSKETFNISPTDLVRTIRLKFAAELLRKNQFTVSEICYKSGFNNRSYFYREFKKVFGDTPKNYQQNHQRKSKTFLNN